MKKSRNKKVNAGGGSPLADINFPSVTFNKNNTSKEYKRKSPKYVKKITTQQTNIPLSNMQRIEPDIEPEKVDPEIVEEEVEPDVEEMEEEIRETPKSPKKWTPLEQLTPKSKKKRLDLLKKLNIMTCSDIKTYLESTDMSDEEKVIFIRQNMTDNRALRSFIEKQHYNLKELNFVSDAGSVILKTIGNEAYKVYELMIGTTIEAEDEVDCQLLKDFVKNYENKQKQPGFFKQALETGVEATKTALQYTGTALYYTGKAAWETGKLLFQGFSYLISKGFQLWTWISSNPRSAYFALLTLKSLKNQLCKASGQALGIFGSSTGTKKKLVAYINYYRPDIQVTEHTSMTILKDVSKPFINDVIGKSIVGLFNKAWEHKQKVVTGALALAFTTVVGPVAGPMIGSGIGMMLDTIMDGAKESVSLIAEQTVYQTDVRNCFTALFELVNPIECIDKMLKEVISPDFSTPTKSPSPSPKKSPKKVPTSWW